MVRLITWAQSISPTLGYVIENTPSQLDEKEKVQEHYTLVNHYLGKLLLFDATQCDSYVHRLRNWWTNLTPLLVMQLALRYTIKNPNLQVYHILDDQSSCQLVTRQEKTFLVSYEHNKKTKRCLAHLCILPRSTNFSGRWTKPDVSSCFSHLGWTKPKRKRISYGVPNWHFYSHQGD